jgi:hypothetical protein
MMNDPLADPGKTMMANHLVVVDIPEKAVRSSSDPKLPMNRTWVTTRLKGLFEGRYLAKCSLLDFGHTWNGSQVLRFETEPEAKYERRRLHLEDCTIVEEVWGSSGRRGSASKHQWVIRLVYHEML